MDFEALELTRADGVAHLTIARPASGNALTLALCRELERFALAVASDPAVRVVVIRGQGRFFCTGGDLKEFLAERDRIRAHVHAMATHFHVALAQLRNAAAPVVTAVNGTAAGGGFSLALNGDVVVAARSARFVPAYTRSGLTPDGGGTWLLPRIVGAQRAFDILATNPVLTADQALAIGMVSRVADDDAFDAEVERVVRGLLAAPPGALASLKRLLRQSAGAAFEAQLTAEADSIADSAARPTTIAQLEEFARRSGV